MGEGEGVGGREGGRWVEGEGLHLTGCCVDNMGTLQR